VDITVDGKPFKAIVDTGSIGIFIPWKFWIKSDKIFQIKEKEGEAWGKKIKFYEGMSRLTLKLGDMTIKDIDVFTHPKNRHWILGNQFLEQFIVTIDTQNLQLILKKY
jgi:predicted aspartyl protease